MIDIHCHILNGVDDGPLKVSDSIRMVLEAESIGINTIVVTPHFHKDIYESEEVMERFLDLKSRTMDFGVELYLGYEVFLTTGFQDIVIHKDKYSINKSKYLLFELPFDIMPIGMDQSILKLHEENMVPILAHPERYMYLVRNMEKFIDLANAGCLVQLDAGSIVGMYGSKVRSFAKQLIKMDMVQFVASDAHCPGAYIQLYKKAYGQVVKWVGKENADELFIHNQNFILKHRMI
jgi:Capsular polysaccharide biosynthesis protein